MNAIQFIKENGVEKAREVVSGAPEWALSYCDEAQDYFAVVASEFDCCSNLCDLREAIAEHDRTDHVTDIKNHISPMTIVQRD